MYNSLVNTTKPLWWNRIHIALKMLRLRGLQVQILSGVFNKNTKMTIIAYILIGIGLFFAFIMWKMWKNHDKIIEEFQISEEEYNTHMRSVLRNIIICYGLAMAIKFFIL